MDNKKIMYICVIIGLVTIVLSIFLMNSKNVPASSNVPEKGSSKKSDEHKGEHKDEHKGDHKH